MIIQKKLFKKYNIDSELQLKFKSAAEKIIGELYKVAFGMTSNKSEAVKLVEECFDDAVKFLNHLDERIEINGWLFRILVNKISNKYPLNIHKIIYEETDSKFGKILDSNSNIKEIEDKVNSIDPDKLQTLVSNLPAGFKLTLILKDILNKNYEGLSDIIDMPVDISALRINYARKIILMAAIFPKINSDSIQNTFDPDTEILITKFVDEELNDDAQISGIKNKIEVNKNLEMNYKIQKKIKELMIKYRDKFSISPKTKIKVFQLLK